MVKIDEYEMWGRWEAEVANGRQECPRFVKGVRFSQVAGQVLPGGEVIPQARFIVCYSDRVMLCTGNVTGGSAIRWTESASSCG